LLAHEAAEQRGLRKLELKWSVVNVKMCTKQNGLVRNLNFEPFN